MNGGMRIDVELPSSPVSTSKAARTSVFMRSGPSATRSFSALISAKLRCRSRARSVTGSGTSRVTGATLPSGLRSLSRLPIASSAGSAPSSASGLSSRPSALNGLTPRASRQKSRFISDTVSCTRSNKSCTQASTSVESRAALRTLPLSVRSFNSSARDRNGRRSGAKSGGPTNTFAWALRLRRGMPGNCSVTSIRTSHVSSTTPSEIPEPGLVSSNVSPGSTDGLAAPTLPNQPARSFRKAFSARTAGTGLSLVGRAAAGGP